jgi:hypothetical protein
MPEAVAIEFTAPGGQPLRVEWPAEALAEASPDAAHDSRAWRLEGELDWDQVEALRVLSAGLGDGRAVALAALRPAGAAGHGEELVAALLVADGAAEEIDQALLSTEYGPDGLPRRVGLELYRADDPIPLRVAADVTASEVEREGGVADVRATLEVRRDGTRGAGVYEILTPG